MEPLSGVTVRIQNRAIATETDERGFYSLTVPDSKAIIHFTRVGYKSVSLEVGLVEGRPNKQDIRLTPDLRTLDEVQVSGNKQNNTNTLGINAGLLQSFPSVSGNFESILKTYPAFP